MSLLLLAPNRDMQPWQKALLEVDANLDIEIWPNITDKKQVQFIVAWDHPKGVLGQFPNLKAISSLGAGVDHIINDKDLAETVGVCRVVCESLVQQMKDYVLHAILNYQHHTGRYFEQQKRAAWQQYPNKRPQDFAVGIMGLGELGRPTGLLFSQLGYVINGWSNSPKDIEGVHTFAGDDELHDFLHETNVLVCMLPLTPATKDILDLDLFKELKQPAYLINVARGEHLVEEDLIYTLDKNLLEGATLDVFTKEPLPEKHPFWNRPTITITPHVCSLTPPKEAAPQIVENYKRAVSGMELINQLDKEKGY